MSFAFHAFRPALYRPVLMACTLCWSLVYAPLIQAAEWNIDQLMHGLAQIKSGHVSFVETKTMAILDRPLVASGDMIYTCLLYTSDAADDLLCVDLGGRRINKKKKTQHIT